MSARRWRALLLFASCASCASCGGGSGLYVPKELTDRRTASNVAQEPARPPQETSEKPPPPLTRVPRRAPRPMEARLSNGVRVIMLERHEFPSATVGIVLDRGASSAPAGVAALYSHALRGSSSEHTRKDAFLYLRYVGASTQTWATRDAVSISTTALSPFVWHAFARIGPMLTKPVFDSEDLTDARVAARAESAAERDRPGDNARVAMMEMLFPSGHPHARPVRAFDDARYEKMSKNELESFQSMFVVAERVSVVAVGDFSPSEMKKELEKHLSSLPKRKAGSPPDPPPITKPPRARITIVHRPGASQSNVAIGFLGAPRAEPVHAPLAILQSLLGRSLSGRLDLKVRGEHGATYGVHMRNHAWREAGVVEISAAIDTPATGKALGGLVAELARVRTEPIEETEINRAKGHAIDGAIDSESSYSALASLAGADLPIDYYDSLEMNIAAQTPADVQRAASTYLATDVAQIAIVGDADVILAPVKALNIGEVTVKR